MLYNIIAYKQSQYATYFFVQDKHVMPKRYMGQSTK